MLPRSLRRSLIGPLDLNSEAVRQSIVGNSVQKQPIAERECRILWRDWLNAGRRWRVVS